MLLVHSAVAVDIVVHIQTLHDGMGNVRVVKLFEKGHQETAKVMIQQDTVHQVR